MTLKFVLQDRVHFIGTAILRGVVFTGVAKLVSAARRR